MLVGRRCSRSVFRARVASRSSFVGLKTQQRTFVASSVLCAEKKKKNTIDFVVPADWDLAYLKKFDIPPPTPEQMAKALSPPLELYGRVGALATDLFQVASVYDVIDTVQEELQSLKKLAKSTPTFADFIEDKGATRKEVRKMFEDVFKTANPVLKKFVARMIENGDFPRILKMTDEYDALVKAHKKEIPVTVYFAKLPPPERLEVLKQRLAFFYLPKGANPVWNIQQRDDLVTGFILSTPDRTVDSSYAKKLADLKERVATIKMRVAAAESKGVYLGTPPPRGLKPSSFQDLAKAIIQADDVRMKREETAYKESFVDWV